MTRLGVVVATALSVLVWSFAASALGPGTTTKIEAEVRETFEDEAFGFCHEADYPLSPAEREFCPMVGSSSSVCPKLPEVCRSDRYPEMQYAEAGEGRGRKLTDFAEGDGSAGQGNGSKGGSGKGAGSGDGQSSRDQGNGSGNNGSGNNGSGNAKRSDDPSNGNGQDASSGDDGRRSGSGDGKSGGDGDGTKDGSGSGKGPEEKAAKPPPPPPKEPEEIEVPGWLAGFARLAFYVLVGAFVAAVIYWIIKNFIRGRDEAPPEEAASSDEPDQAAPVVPRGPVETDVDRLLARARKAAQAGNFREAVEAAYAALLRRLEGDGLIDMHPSRTNGDYVRQVRERPELRHALRDIARDVERMQFGTEPPGQGLFDSVYRRVLPLVGRAAVVLGLLLGLGGQMSCRASGDGDARAARTLALGDRAPGGTSPFGTRAVFELLTERGKSVTVNRSDEPVLDDQRTIVLLPDAPVDAEGWRKLMRWVEDDGGQLIVAGHRVELEYDLGVLWGERRAEAPVRAVSTAPSRLMGYELAVPRFGRLMLDPDRPLRVQVVLARTEGFQEEAYAVQRTTPSGGRVVVFADDSLFKNIALAAGDNAAFLIALFSDMPRENVEVWDGFTGAGSAEGARGAASPLDSMRESKLGPVLLHLLALVVLYLIYRGTRFGTPQDPRVVSRRAFSEHVRALGLAYSRARVSRHALGLYTAWAMERLRDRFGGTRQRGLIPLAEAVAERTGQTPAQVTEVLVEAGSARDEAAPPSSYRHNPLAAPQQTSGSARDFWIMRQLESFLAASHGKTKGR
jgi:hypothetical protein